MSNAICIVSSIGPLTFETITDWLILVIYILKLLKVTKTEMKRLIHQSGKWYTDDKIDGLLMERHLAKKARRSGKHHLKGPPERTEEDDRHFAESFERMIIQAEDETG